MTSLNRYLLGRGGAKVYRPDFSFLRPIVLTAQNHMIYSTLRIPSLVPIPLTIIPLTTCSSSSGVSRSACFVWLLIPALRTSNPRLSGPICGKNSVVPSVFRDFRG